MKAFLLAAGEGTRLKPLTDCVPKCLVPIAGVPLLGIWLNWCCRYGIDEVLINTHAHASAVRAYLAANKPQGLRITVSHETELLGSAGTVRHNRAFVAGVQRFAIFYADVLTNVDFASMAAFHERHGGLATLGVYHVAEPSRCGIVSTDANGLITEFIEKPHRPASDLAFSGLMIASPAVLDEIPPKMPADVGFDLLPKLVSRMYAFPIADYLMDIGTMKSYQTAQAEWTDSALRQRGTAC